MGSQFRRAAHDVVRFVCVRALPKMSRSRVLSLLALVVIGVGAAVAFTVVVWPTRYAKGVLAFERAFRSPDSPFASSASLSGDDIAGALRRINQWKAFLAGMQERIEALRPAPPQYRQLQDDLEAGIQWFQEQIATLEQYTRFLGGARELYALIQSVLTPGAGALTVGQFLDQYGPELTKIRELGDALFSGNLPRVPEIADLRGAWTDAAASFELLRATLRAQPPGRSLQGAIEQLRTAELRAAEETLEQFTQRLEVVTTAPVPSMSSSPESASPELKERFERIGATLDALRQRYPEYAVE